MLFLRDLLQSNFVIDCEAVYNAGERQSSVYTVDPDGKEAVNAYCEMVTDGGGLAVIQRRINGSISFDREWDHYKDGFGSLSGEFWFGNENIHRLTSSGKRELRVELEDWDGNTAYTKYGTFGIGDESSQYNLTWTHIRVQRVTLLRVITACVLAPKTETMIEERIAVLNSLKADGGSTNVMIRILTPGIWGM